MSHDEMQVETAKVVGEAGKAVPDVGGTWAETVRGAVVKAEVSGMVGERKV